MTKNKQTMKMAAAIIVLVAAAGVYLERRRGIGPARSRRRPAKTHPQILPL